MIMAGEFTTRVRLVRCPKCRKVLPELPEFNVYKCGGCGATLQAKNRVNNARSMGSSLTDADAILEDGMDCVHEDKDELSSSDDVIVPGLGECPPCEDNERDQSGSEVCEDEQLGGANLSTENQKNGSYQGDSSDCDNEGSEVSNEVFSPTDFVDHKNGDFALEENEEPANGNTSFVGNWNGELAHDEKLDLIADNEEEEIAQNESAEFAHDEAEEFAHEEDDEFTQETSHDEKEESNQNEGEDPVHNQNEPLPLAEADLEVPVNHDSSPLAEASTIDTDKKSDIHSDVRSSNAVSSVAAMENGSSSSAPLPLRDSLVNTLVSSHSEQLKPPQRSVHQGYANLKSEEFNPSPELSGSHRDMSKPQ